MEFVNYELALKLEEMGFNWTCSHYYRTKCKDLFMVFPSEDWSNTEERINAPTIAQVLKWLREEKRIAVGAVWDNKEGKWVGYVNKMDMPYLVGEYVLPNTYDTYEQAAIAGIEYVLDNLI